MTPPMRRFLRSAVLAAGLAALTACADPFDTPFGHANADRQGASPQALAACRQRADQVYEMQNRNAVYTADMYAGSQRDAPLSGLGGAANPSTGLSGRYAHETMVDDCLNGASGSADVGTGAAAPQH